ncbi:protein Jumonji-like [Cydia pomonella]|uniref:protein Jumonji-like n=1 Tax=Cydia pomonella TaxID=82600 RepID=UPI002ADDDE31|nr:protein Jumonji-like [Cydia pomonella]XP_061729097.1 protein Jumonji-like [Cydia pomonella]XP_061729105.1 protein Jumonji-like [Cydia pomonella]XP_061729272.1 protein Jumonji-like [Cydia pomonella]XP_061729283.1 protein Jumonji-like [Cydia pomonella]XP_061729387.1 protein Jumonji-like [Cydia pomonella]XP_061729400.1 protein Jumonji-like [Cydia pomonella]
MVPPNILSEHGVKLSRLLQRPGEYVLVFPEAHSCSITTGFGISESVYFASNAWLTDVFKLFQELRNSCEPTMFSLEQLLLNGSADSSAPHQVCSVLATLLSAELEHRRALDHKGLKVQERPPSSAPLNTSYFRAWNTRDQDECEYCRSTLFLSKVRHH